MVLNGGTQLVAYTGTTHPTTVPANATDAAAAHVVFVATVSDADNDGGYSIVQYQPLDHESGSTLFSTITLGFSFTATDADGDTATGTFTTTVNDTGPSIGHSTSAIVSEDGPMSVTGAPLAIDFGADSGSFAGSDRALAFTDNTGDRHRSQQHHHCVDLVWPGRECHVDRRRAGGLHRHHRADDSRGPQHGVHRDAVESPAPTTSR